MEKFFNQKSTNLCKPLSASAMLQASQGCLAGVAVHLVSQGFGGGRQGKTMLLCPLLPRQEGKVRGWVLCGLSGRVGERQLLGRCRSEDEHDVDCAASGKGHLREALLLHEEALRVNRFHNCVDEKNDYKNNNSDHSSLAP